MSSDNKQPTPAQIDKEAAMTDKFATAVRIAVAALTENKIVAGNYGHNIAVATLAAEVAKIL